jgi:hypothetical protein
MLLENHWESRCLLDILAYVLWCEHTVFELSGEHLSFGKKLYQKILEEMKQELYPEETPDNLDIVFDDFNLQFQLKGELFFFEERLKKLEEKLKERVKKTGCLAI